MLVLSRRIGEEIVIGGDISIRIASIQGGRIRLAISAPPDVPVDRAEVHQRRGQFSVTANGNAAAELVCSHG